MHYLNFRKRHISLGGLYNLCTKETRKIGVSIGYGHKSDFSLTTTRGYPSPLTYTIPALLDIRLKEHYGATIKLKYPEKVKFSFKNKREKTQHQDPVHIAQMFLRK